MVVDGGGWWRMVADGGGWWRMVVDEYGTGGGWWLMHMVVDGGGWYRWWMVADGGGEGSAFVVWVRCVYACVFVCFAYVVVR